MTDEELEAIDPAHTPGVGERELLEGFLDYYRAVMVRKAQGLTREQLTVRVEPSDLTIGGLIKHLALVEESWFQERLLGKQLGEPWASVDWDADPDWEFRTAADDEPDALLEIYDRACASSRAAIAEVVDLGTLTQTPNRRGEHFSTRWILVHMIEETARHAGHADLIRQRIDDTTGD